MTEEAAWEKYKSGGGEQRGGKRREMGDEGMLALRRGTCCCRRRGNLGGRSTVGGTWKWGVRRGSGRGWH